MTTSGTRTPACAAMRSRQGLVLDLFQAADGRASRRIAVGEEPPAPSEPLRVLRVAAEHAYLERTTVSVATDVLRVAEPLPLGRGKVAHVDAERRQRVDHPRRRRHARGRAEQKPHERTGAEAERERGKRS